MTIKQFFESGALICLLGLASVPVYATQSATGETYLGVRTNHQSTSQDFTQCPQNFYAGEPPILVGKKGNKLAKKSYSLCFDGFAVLYSGVSKTPIWSAEYLTHQRVSQAKTLTREDSFHVESRLPHAVRSQLSDYSRSGFDRGHLSPNGDMENKSQQFDSFSLANIAPQNGTHNRGIWRYIETSTRYLAGQYDEVYVVTGVVFLGDTVESIGSGVLVPSHFFKAIYVPSIHKAGVYYSANHETGDYQLISLDELAKRTGIDAMPHLPDDVKGHAWQLPKPMTDDKIASPSVMVNQEETSGWLTLLVAILKVVIGWLS